MVTQPSSNGKTHVQRIFGQYKLVLKVLKYFLREHKVGWVGKVGSGKSGRRKEEEILSKHIKYSKT